MKDRIPTYPGRVQLLPVAGQENIYDMTMADDPKQLGDPPTKANLLQDATASALGLDPTKNPVVDDAFMRIADEMTELNDLVLSRTQMQFGSYDGAGTSGSDNPNTLTFDFAPKIVWFYAAESYNVSTGATTAIKQIGNDGSTYSDSSVIVIMDKLTTEDQTGIGPYGNSSNAYNNSRSKKSEDGKTLTWWTSLASTYQLNSSGYRYHWVAIR